MFTSAATLLEREYVERRYGYSNYRRHYGCYSYGGCRPRYGYYSDGDYRPQPRPYDYGYGYGGVGRRWPAPYLDGSYGDGYESAAAAARACSG